MDLPTPTLHISRNKEATQASMQKERTVLFASRSEVQVGQFSSDLLELRELKTYAFPYAASAETWSDSLRLVIEPLIDQELLCVIQPDEFLIIPDSLYREQDSELYFHLSNEKTSDFTTLVHHSSQNNIVLLSRVPSVINNIFKNTTPFADVQLYIDHPILSAKSQLHLIIRDEHIDVIVRNPKLQLANRYNADHENDILYFSVTCCEQSGIKLDECEVVITGLNRKLSSVKNLLSRYFSNVKTADVPSKVKTPYGFKDVEPATYFSLLNTYRCE